MPTYTLIDAQAEVTMDLRGNDSCAADSSSRMAWDPMTNLYSLPIDSLTVSFIFPFRITLCTDHPDVSLIDDREVRFVRVDPNNGVSFLFARPAALPVDTPTKAACSWEPVYGNPEGSGAGASGVPVIISLVVGSSLLCLFVVCLCSTKKRAQGGVAAGGGGDGGFWGGGDGGGGDGGGGDGGGGGGGDGGGGGGGD